MLSDKTLKALQKAREEEIREYYEYKGVNLDKKVVVSLTDLAKSNAKDYYFGCNYINIEYWLRKQKLIKRLQNLKKEQSEIEIDKAIKIIKQII